MNLDNKLSENLGRCIFPVGDCKTLCGEPTLLDSNGNHTPFCAKHSKDVARIFREKINKKKNRKGVKVVARAYK